MDGAILAYDVRAQGTGCNRLRAWNVKNGKTWLVSGKGTCIADSTSTGAGVREIAVAGSRVGWIVNLGGNTESNDVLFAAVLPKPKETRLGTATRKGEAGSMMGTGRFLGNLVGDGGLLAINDFEFQDDLFVSGSLRRVAPGLAILATGEGTAAAADTTRIALLGLGNVASIWKQGSGFGTPIQLPGPAREAALHADLLAVLLASGQIRIYSASSGAPVQTVSASADAANLDVHGGIVVWSVGRRLYAARIGGAGGAPIVSAGRKIEAVELEAPGLAYAWNTTSAGKEAGKLAFVKAATLQAAVP